MRPTLRLVLIGCWMLFLSWWLARAFFLAMSSIPGLVIISCWAVFLWSWMISSFFVKRTVERESFGSSLSYRIPVILGAVLVAAPQFPPPLDNQIIPQSFFTAWAGAALSVAGLLVALWARLTLGRNWSSDVTFKQDHQLTRTGPYRFARHPIYTGILLLWLGVVVAVGQWRDILGLAITCVGFWIKLKQEESVMLRHFPEYADYRKQVKAIVPFVI